jgi:hypothetical protein
MFHHKHLRVDIYQLLVDVYLDMHLGTSLLLVGEIVEVDKLCKTKD